MHAIHPQSLGVAEVLDRYDAVIGLDYQFPAESFRGIRRLAALARWGVGYDMVDVEGFRYRYVPRAEEAGLAPVAPPAWTQRSGVRGVPRRRLAGRKLKTAAPEKIVVRAGESLCIPPNVPHSVESLEDSVAVDIFSPVREDWVRGDDAYLRG